MLFKEWYILNEVSQVNYEEIEKRKLFGPVYHGTTEENKENILKYGFNIYITGPREEKTRHGYSLLGYGQSNIPPPVHHLGYGIYFTTVKTIAQKYQGNNKKLLEFYLDVPKLEIINFGSTNTMMKWWISNGYDMPPLNSLKDLTPQEIEKIRINATYNLTKNLKSKFDAVLYKGKGLTTLLDGNQICTYNTNKIYLYNPTLNKQDDFAIGERIKLKNLPIAVKITGRRPFKYSKGLDNFFNKIYNHNPKYTYYVQLSKNDAEKIKNTFIELLQQEIDEETIEIIMKNSGKSRQDAVSHATNYFFDKNRLELNFPEALFEKKLQKRERIKN